LKDDDDDDGDGDGDGDGDDAFLKQMQIEYMWPVRFCCAFCNYLANDTILIRITKHNFA
jgi:hypothetical protein